MWWEGLRLPVVTFSLHYVLVIVVSMEMIIIMREHGNPEC